ncbi:hypothetical protein PPYR_14042 [Photinus pyralis]|uniref:C2H2-type domain-containing protein n=1 Tax=Photinus pyralis TaxID=7054 RepID=A0A5N4A447_PHOPY|nr:zinc finger protein Helios-like [Photinus pyralis]XP_031357785.1 zinc finger protein Helios-like [Photinus pyralis]KAB0792081.1 hypothetical protein PPYR_14042 [Photinus pyralis]
MSILKRKRLDDSVVLQTINIEESALLQTNPSLLQQQILLGPVIDDGKHILENSQIQIMNNSNILATDPAGHSNTFIVLPQNGEGGSDTQTILQSIPVYLLVPREQSVKQPDVNPTANTPILIKDVRTVKHEVEEEDVRRYTETIYLDSMDEDPLLPDPDVKADGAINPNDWKHRSLYKCDFPGCPKMFLYPHDRKVHKDSHIFPAGTEYKCSICNMSFKQAIDRNKHVESHSIPSTHVCSFCKASFPYYTTLIQHINNTCCLSKCVKCRFCNIPFANREDARQHEIKLHISYSKEKLARARRPMRHARTPVDTDNVIVLD